MYREVPDALQFAITLACPSSRVRSLISSEQGLLSWLATRGRFQPQVGAEYTLEMDGDVGAVEGRVQGFDPGLGMAFTLTDHAVKRAFGLTVCRWAWEPLSADYTLLTLIHTGHGQGDSWQRAYELHLRMWSHALGNLASLVNEGVDRRKTQTTR